MTEFLQRGAALAREMQSKGVRLWVDQGNVHYQALKSGLSEAEITLLRSSKRELIAWLSQGQDNDVSSTAKFEANATAMPNRVPFAYSQQAHWNIYRLQERPSIRQIASALRLRGRLDTEALWRSLKEITRRHDALRLKIAMRGGCPVQEISHSIAPCIHTEDMSRLPAAGFQLEANARISEFLLGPVCVRTDPLFGVLLMRIAGSDHILVLAMEHLISDAFSMDLVLRELFTAYGQIVARCAVTLPPIAMQFSALAGMQRDHLGVEIKTRAAKWKDHLSRCRYERFCPDHTLSEERYPGLGTVPVQITAELKSALREWCRINRTTMVMGAFTAFVALTMRWRGLPETIVQYMTDGRDQPELENTVGYLASPIYLRARLDRGDTFTDLLRAVKEEFCAAYEHADHWYLEAQPERPTFAHCGMFNWVPQGRNYDRSALEGTGFKLDLLPVQLDDSMLVRICRDNDPSIALFESDAAITGGVYFPLRKFSRESMVRFGSAYLTFLRSMANNCAVRIRDISLAN